MSDVLDNPRAVIGGNNPPPTPLEAMEAHIGDLFAEAVNFLDGEEITTQGQADAVGALIDAARKAEKDGNAARVTETKPLDEAKKAIMDAWRPLVDEKTGKCRLIIQTANKALAPFLAAEQARLDAIAAEKRRIADEAAAVAQAAIRAADVTDLAAREQAEQALKEFDAFERQAAKAGKQKAFAGGGSRSIGLRSVLTPALVNPVEALKHYRERQPAALKMWLLKQAEHDVRAGARSIPGFTITEEKVAR